MQRDFSLRLYSRHNIQAPRHKQREDTATKRKINMKTALGTPLGELAIKRIQAEQIFVKIWLSLRAQGTNCTLVFTPAAHVRTNEVLTESRSKSITSRAFSLLHDKYDLKFRASEKNWRVYSVFLFFFSERESIWVSGAGYSLRVA